MKFIFTLLFLCCINFSAFGQEPKEILVDFIWNLNQLTVDGTVVDWSFNDEMGTVGATFDYDGTSEYYLSAGACNGIFADLSAVDNTTFTAMDFSITPNECNLPETIAFETAYFDEFFKINDPNHTFTYTIDMTDPNFPDLTITNEVGDMAFFNGESMLGLNQSEIVDFVIFPNPTDNYLEVVCKNSIVERFSIYNIQGQKMMQLNFQQNEQPIDISSLQSGVYFLKAESDTGQQFTAKFVKK